VDENARLTAGETLNSARTVNALLLDGSNVSVAGTGTLTIASGALFHRSGTGISNPLSFGSTEANIFVSSATGDLVLNSVISGSNGLTKSGVGRLTLGAANTFTGPLTINAGTVAFSAADRLGATNSAIVINGNGAGVTYTGSSSLNFNRPIETRTGLAKIDVSGTGDLNIAMPIAGAGGLQVTTANNRTITLAPNSTYTGTTYLGGGRVAIANDSAFGAGGALHINGGTITLSGAWNSTREINIQAGTLDTAGFDAVWSGELTSVGGAGNLGNFTKRGAGELQLTGQSNFGGNIAVQGGALTLTGDGENRCGHLG
jgi:autotransporter-associated beta strand protein